MQQPEQPPSSSPLQTRSLTVYLAVRISTTFTMQMVSVAVGWQIYALTHSAFYLGMVGLVQFIPMVLLTLVVGMAADRFSRKGIICLCQAVETAVFF
ncbi:MAG: MFS transporter, partial [Clostridia bacterium]|nr:MFS transporter [Clostridia bacterium]